MAEFLVKVWSTNEFAHVVTTVPFAYKEQSLVNSAIIDAFIIAGRNNTRPTLDDIKVRVHDYSHLLPDCIIDVYYS